VRVTLRPVRDADLTTLFEQQRDEEANRMAAFGAADPHDRAAFDARWKRILADPSVVVRAIEADDGLAGSILRWRDESLEAPEVSYWLGREFWDKGVASEALRLFIDLLPDRRLYGRVASTNPGSLRVLDRCGFSVVRVERDVEGTAGQRIEELVLLLER
jgi:RimJ/RimL family protein N-acetyltransferase